jgi:hypothetical protein
MVEQRTENPCVPSSILGDATLSKPVTSVAGFFVLQNAIAPFRFEPRTAEEKSTGAGFNAILASDDGLQMEKSAIRA